MKQLRSTALHSVSSGKGCLKPVFGVSTVSPSTGQETSVVHTYRTANRKHTGHPQLSLSGQMYSWSLTFYKDWVEWSLAEFALCCRTVFQHLSFYWKKPNPVQPILFAKDSPSHWSKCGHIAQQFKEAWRANPDLYISQVEIKDTQRSLCGRPPWGV